MPCSNSTVYVKQQLELVRPYSLNGDVGTTRKIGCLYFFVLQSDRCLPEGVKNINQRIDWVF